MEGAVEALAVIKDFDVIEEGEAEVGQAMIGVEVNEFSFESAPERFHGGVVIAVAAATHAGSEVADLEQGVEAFGAVLAAAIGMMDQSLARASARQGLLEGIGGQSGV